MQERHPETLDEIREVLDGGRTLDSSGFSDSHGGLLVDPGDRRGGSTTPGSGRTGQGHPQALSRQGYRSVESTGHPAPETVPSHRCGLADHRHAPSRPFPRRYTNTDVELLAEVDALHGTLSGPATRRLCARASQLFGDLRFERLAGISNGHLYNLRRSKTYRGRRRVMPPSPTCPMALGKRWRPRPFGQPGHLRVVSVGQGDLDALSGLYHLELVDEVTKFRFVGSVERLDEP